MNRIIFTFYIIIVSLTNLVIADEIPTKSSEVDLTPAETNSNHTTYFLLEINPPLAIDASVDYFTKDGSAIAGEDYISKSGKAVIKAGETRTVIGIEIIGDTKKESNETFSIVMRNPKGANFPAGKTELIASKTIIDDDSNGNTTVSLSGKISASALIDTDSDINDPTSTKISNDTFTSAQKIENFYTINGFASELGTSNFGDTKGNFSTVGDMFDVYKVDLQAKQQITLQIVDYTGKDVFKGDLDLGLFDTNGNLIATSESVNEIENISVPADGSYYIVVKAYSGVSKYVLSLGNIPTSSGSNGFTGKAMGEFVPNEAVITYRSSQILPAYIIQSNTNLILSHQQTDRAVLAKFIQPTAPLFRTLASNQLPPFLQELKLINPKSFEKFNTLTRIKELNLNPSVQIAEPNYIRQAYQVPNDKFYSLQWHYPAVNLPQAWDITEGKSEIVVAVIDSGVFLAHEDLTGQLVTGYDFIRDISNALDGDGIDANPDDPGDKSRGKSSSWHGTHVAGTIAAKSNNGIGIAGIAPNAKIMPLRVLGGRGGDDYDIGQAILYAAGLPNDSGSVPIKKADIINMSLGGASGSQFSQTIISQARAQGVIIIAASGNDGDKGVSHTNYPASYAGVISVAATNMQGQRAYYSDFTDSVDIAAPGGDVTKDLNVDGYTDGVLSTLVDDSTGTRKSHYVFYQGTSMASPHVSGIIALMKSVYPQLTPDEFDRLLISGQLTEEAGATGKDPFYGYGILNAAKAVKVAFELNNGGTTQTPALIKATPSSLNFSPNDSNATLVLENLGSMTASITSISTNTTWLSVQATTVDPTTHLGSYTVSVNRDGLNNTSYTGQITFHLSTGKSLLVEVSMSVGTQVRTGKLSQLYVLLFGENGDLIAETKASKTSSMDIVSYQFDNVPSGNYYIYAGSDIDNDQFICQLSENCGGYPILSRASKIEVGNQNIDNLNFVATILSTISTSSSSTLFNKETPLLWQGIKRETPLENPKSIFLETCRGLGCD